jgi:small nuclear ribonucleoprotein (snRNP)-like protein
VTAGSFVLVCLVLAVVLAGAMVALYLAQHSPSLLVARQRRRVLVTLKGGDAFAGVLYATDREAIVLREAEALAYGAKKENVIVEGELMVLRAEVAYLQVVPAVTS